MCCSSSTTLEEKTCQKLIVKIHYPSHKSKPEEDDHDSKRRKIQHDNSSEKSKPIVTSYWVDASAKHPTTTTLSHSKKDDNIVENNNNMINNHVSKTSVKESSQLKEDSTITTTLLSRQKSNNVHTLKRTRTAVSVDQRYSKMSSFAKETSGLSENPSKESQPKHAKGSTTMSQEKSDGEKAKKKPMQRLKRWRCWVMLKRMMVGRDSWDVKEPLKDVEDKLRVYSNPKEFAYDMRHVFSNVFSLNPPRTEIYKVAKRLCDSFEQRWNALNDEWALEDRKRKKIHKTKRKLFS